MFGGAFLPSVSKYFEAFGLTFQEKSNRIEWISTEFVRFHVGRSLCRTCCPGAATSHGGEGARPARGRDGDAEATWREKMWGPGCGV